MNNTKYWFYIEPYCHVSVTTNKVMVINTFNKEKIANSSSKVIELIKRSEEKEQFKVHELSEEQLKQKEINAFVNQLRSTFSGDIIPQNFSKEKPVQILPEPIFLNGRLKFLNKKSKGVNNVYPWIREISIDFGGNKSLSTPFDIDLCKQLLFLDKRNTQTLDLDSIKPFIDDILAKNSFCTFRLTGNSLYNSDYIKKVKDIFKEHDNRVCIQFYYQKLVELINSNQINFLDSICPRADIFIDKSTAWENVTQIHQLLQKYEIDTLFTFIIENEGCLTRYEEVSTNNPDAIINVQPIYTGNNIEFLREHVFLNEDDIIGGLDPIKEIHLRKYINQNFFGKLHINALGKIYANINFEPLGNIKHHSIHDIINKELTERNTWRMIRNQKPCSECVYQYLCPSPSEIEINSKQSNLCNVDLN
ncbi:MAG: TIGR04150 pseudo-rSAM protein [Hyphomicrobiales bacterium]